MPFSHAYSVFVDILFPHTYNILKYFTIPWDADGGNMNKQHVRIFLKIAELGSISGAAQALHYSQPTISYGLAQLEKELGFPLVIRRQGVRQTGLTPAGKAFVPLAQRLLEVQGEISSFIQSQTPNILRLCSNNTLHSYLIPALCHRLVEKVPGIDLRMGVWQNNTIPDALTRYFHDIAIYSGFYEGSDLIRSIPFFDEGFCLLCPADTPLPNRTISLQELDPRYAVIPGVYLQENIDTLEGDAVFLAWYREYFPEDVLPYFKPPQMLSVGDYLTDRRCWAPIPESTARHLADRSRGDLVIRPLDTIPRRCIHSILISKAYSNQNLVDALLESCGGYVDQRPWLRKLLP